MEVLDSLMAHRDALRCTRVTPQPKGLASAAATDGPKPGESPLALVVLGVRQNALKVRREDGGIALFRPADGVVSYVPGEILAVRPGRMWTFGRTLHLTGEVVRRHLAPRRLGLTPLRLFQRGLWEPGKGLSPENLEVELEEHPDLAAVYRAGARPAYEMEQVVPGADDEDSWGDPIDRAVEVAEAGDLGQARKILSACLEADLRCLDAHAHLGKLAFESRLSPPVGVALRHYRVGVAVGDLSLGESFRGVLPSGFVNNRPFLRCLHGLGLTWWRLGEPGQAREVFRRLLWLDPEDRMGARFCLADIRRGFTWEQATFVEEAALAASGGAWLSRPRPKP